MKNHQLKAFLEQLIQNTPSDWLKLTTHRLDIYNEARAKFEFLEQLELVFNRGEFNEAELAKLPTAYDYIRLGHPLSSVLEWSIAKELGFKPDDLIAFASETMALMAILRENLMRKQETILWYEGSLPSALDLESLKQVYNYQFKLKEWQGEEDLTKESTPSVFISEKDLVYDWETMPKADFYISRKAKRGSIVLINAKDSSAYVKAIQHVRRRESIAMTPADCFSTLKEMLSQKSNASPLDTTNNLADLRSTIAQITASKTPALLASSGLSIQYAIMMGLVDDALEKHPGKAIKIIVPPNCYGGTNDQARRVAASHEKVSIMDLPVDGRNDMVKSTQVVLEASAALDAVPLIIAEIPTNPRVEVPNLKALRETLAAKRLTPEARPAVEPVFILDQTFCPNYQFLKPGGIFAEVSAISYVSGSKFPSGGKCTAGYCVANEQAASLMAKIEKHLAICDNQATDLQIEILKEQMPSMNERIAKAYRNTREFVSFIESELPEAKINFVSEELAQQGFTPSVFSLDLPTKGESPEERESYKRMLNQRLINSMISEIPNESKYCVSYGQLKGCYWTIPATSTQGTTKEEDKDYIARVSVSPKLDLEKHKEVFKEFVASL